MSERLKILITGHGRMGREVEAAARERGHSVTGFVSRGGRADWPDVRTALEDKPADVVIDFTHADAVEAIVAACLVARVPLVTGTTGWSERLEALTKLVAEEGGALLHSPNFSMGVRLFQRLAERAARAYGSIGGWDVGVVERHHERKADAPSGTALELAGRLARAHPGKDGVSTHGSPGARNVHVAALRTGHEYGRHEVILDGPDDLVEIHHSARGRRGFATGAVRGAEWLHQRTGVHDMDDVIDDLLQSLDD